MYALAFFFIFNLTSLIFNLKSATAASPSGSLEVSPSFIDVVLEKAQETKQVVLSYKNNSSKPISLEIFPIDFRQADGTGAINFLGAESGSFSYSLASFLSFEANTLQLEGGEEKDFTVTISNREDLSPGGHYAAVVARMQALEPSDGGQAQVSPALSSLILLRKVGGERFNMSLSDLDFPQNFVVLRYPLTITALFRNEGNIHVVPFGTAEIRDVFGRMINKGVVNTSSLRVFPETRRYIAIDMQKTAWSLPISFNTITLQGEDSLQKVEFRYKDSFVYVNPVFFGGLLLVLVIAGVVKRKMTKKQAIGKKEK